MNDGQLFDAPPITYSALTDKPVRARTTDPGPSHKAAERAQTNAGTVRAQVLLTLDGMGQATADQVRDRIRQTFNPKIKDSSPRSRLKDLRDEGLVAIVRRSAENQAVYTITDRGHSLAMDLRAASNEREAA